MATLDYQRPGISNRRQRRWSWWFCCAIALFLTILILDILYPDRTTTGEQLVSVDLTVIDAFDAKPVQNARISMVFWNARFSPMETTMNWPTTGTSGRASFHASVMTAQRGGLLHSITSFARVEIRVMANGYETQDTYLDPGNITTILGVGPRANLQGIVELKRTATTQTTRPDNS